MLTHFYHLKPWEIPRLTASQLYAYTSQVGFIRYLRDLPEREYHFSKMGAEGWKALAEMDPDDEATPDPIQVRARRRFYAAYDLPEHQSPVPVLAAVELVRAIDAGRAPRWVTNITPDYLDIKDKATRQRQVDHDATQ